MALNLVLKGTKINLASRLADVPRTTLKKFMKKFNEKDQKTLDTVAALSKMVSTSIDKISEDRRSLPVVHMDSGLHSGPVIVPKGNIN